MSALAVLKKVGDHYNVLNVIDIAGNPEKAMNVANKLAQDWRNFYPVDRIMVTKTNGGQCKAVNNIDGFKHLK